jgi:hypothetical protein
MDLNRWVNNAEQLPIWLQWIIIFIIAVPIFAAWSSWQYVMDKARRVGERLGHDLANKKSGGGSKPFVKKPIPGVYERTLGKLMGLVLLVATLYLLGAPMFVRFWKVAGFTIGALALLGFLKRSAALEAAENASALFDLVQDQQPDSK